MTYTLDQAVAWAALPIQVIVDGYGTEAPWIYIYDWREQWDSAPGYQPPDATAAYTALRRRLLSEGKKS